MVSTSAWHAAGRGLILGQTTINVIIGLKTWLRDCVYLCLSEETLTSVGNFYPVSMPGEIKYPTQGVNV